MGKCSRTLLWMTRLLWLSGILTWVTLEGIYKEMTAWKIVLFVIVSVYFVFLTFFIFVHIFTTNTAKRLYIYRGFIIEILLYIANEGLFLVVIITAGNTRGAYFVIYQAFALVTLGFICFLIMIPVLLSSRPHQTNTATHVAQQRLTPHSAGQGIQPRNPWYTAPSTYQGAQSDETHHHAYFTRQGVERHEQGSSGQEQHITYPTVNIVAA